jgi:hypothetical protein
MQFSEGKVNAILGVNQENFTISVTVFPRSADSSTLKMEASGSSETMISSRQQGVTPHQPVTLIFAAVRTPKITYFLFLFLS